MGSPLEKRRLGVAWALASALGGGAMAVPWKLANEAGDPATSVLIMVVVAGLGNSVLLGFQHLRQPRSALAVTRTELGVATVLAALTLLGNLASAIAIQELSPAVMNVLLRADLVFVAIVGWWWLGERVEGRFWIGTAVAIAGLWIMQEPSGTQGAAASAGTGWALAAATCFGSMAILTRRFISAIDPATVNTVRLWIAVALWFPFNAVPDPSTIPAAQLLHASLAAIAGPFLGRLMLMISARYIEARLTTLATLLTPVITLGLAFALLGDWPSRGELLGGALMVLGIAFPLVRSDTRARRSHRTETPT